MNGKQLIVFDINLSCLLKTVSIVLGLFVVINLQAQQISIIGSATPSNDWETDHNMI